MAKDLIPSTHPLTPPLTEEVWLSWLRLLRSHGMTAPTLDRHRGVATGYDVVLAGYNGRLDEVRAALLRASRTAT